MNSEARKILEDAGWFEGRRIDTKEIVACLIRKGYPVLTKQVEFFSEFGGLKFDAADRQSRIDLDLVELSREWLPLYDKENFNEDSMFPGERVSFLGRFIQTIIVEDEIYEYIYILMAESGGVFLSADTWERIVGMSH